MPWRGLVPVLIVAHVENLTSFMRHAFNPYNLKGWTPQWELERASLARMPVDANECTIDIPR